MRDAQTIFSSAQVISALAQASTNQIDLADINQQIGQAVSSPRVRIRVNTTFSGGGMTVLSFYLQDAAPATLTGTTPGAFANMAVQLTNIPIASLVAGNDLLDVYMPITGGLAGIALTTPNQPDTLADSPMRRFIQLYYVVDAIPVTGALDAWLEVN